MAHTTSHQPPLTAAPWAVICESAHVDRFSRLYLFGLETAGAIRTVPVGAHRLSIVMHLPDRPADDDPDVAVFVTSPSGDWRVADHVRDFCVESAGDYVLVHMPSLSVSEEGTYGVEVACGTAVPSVCQLSVRVTAQPQRMPPRGCVR